MSLAPQESFELSILGREDEQAFLRQRVDGVALSGSAIVLEGDAGIGKTILLDDVVAWAGAQAFRVLKCTGIQGSSTLGFVGLHELLHPLLPFVDTLPVRQRAALLTAFGMEEGPAPDRLLVGLAALGLLEEAASHRPILIAVEDMHWLDPSTLAAVNFVGLRVAPAQIVMVGTQRTGTDSQISPSIAIERLSIGPLEDADAALLLERTAPELTKSARSRILRESAGNPLALREVPAALRQQGVQRTALKSRLPTTKRLERAFLDQLDGIPEKSRLLLILAAASDGASIQDIMTAARVLDLAPDDLDPLEERELVIVSDDTFRFRHPLLRSAIESAASTAQWSSSHLALAAAMEGRERATWHRAAATLERDESVARELESAAARARDRGALPESASAFQRASMLSQGVKERARRLALAAETARSAGLTHDALELLDEVDTLASDHETMAQATLTRVTLSLTAGGPEPRRDDVREITNSLSGAEDIERKVLVLWGSAIVARGRSFPETEWQRISAELRAIETTSPLKTVALACLAPIGDVPALKDMLPSLVPQLMDFPLGMVSLAIAAEAVQDLELAFSAWTYSQEKFHYLRAAADETQSLRGRANVNLLRGNIHEGLADAEYAERMAVDTHQPILESMSLATVARAHAYLGDFAAAEDALRRCVDLAKRGPLSLISADARWAGGLIALAQNRYRDAFIEFTHIAVHATRATWAIADRTEAAVRSGRPESVRENVDAAEVVCLATRSPHLSALVARSRALLSDDNEAEAHYERSIALGLVGESRLELARTRLLFGEWLRRQRRITEAREQLVAALRDFDEIGAMYYAERAATELRAAGEVPRRQDNRTQPAEGLTPQEIQVARMAAAGLSNKEIADKIYLSHRTVSTHLYKVFPKLGITARNQLKDALQAAGYDS